MGTGRMFRTDFARRVCCRLLCATGLAVPAFCLNPTYQISQYAHTSWSSEAGLQAVRRIKQTPDGYLWLATRGGLVRFDGVRFTTFKAGAQEGLESSTMQDIVIDPDGSMWIATLGGGIIHYQAGRFHSYTSQDGLPSDDIGSIYRDSRGTLWVGTRGGGMARMAGQRFEPFDLGIPPSRITAFVEDSDPSLWVAALGYGVFRVKNGTLTSFTAREGLPDNRVTGFCRDHSGTIWTAGWKGVSSWNGTRFIPQPAVNTVVTYAISCTEDHDGNLWVASSSGLVRLHGGVVSKMDRNWGLSGDFVADVFEDREGNLWVGTRGGLDRLRDGQIRLFGEREGFLANPGPMVTGEKGDIWTVSNKQIARISGGTIRAWPLFPRRASTPRTLLSEPGAGFLIGFDDGIRRWTSGEAHSPPELTGLGVQCLLQARDGSIWMGTANRGLLRWRPSGRSGTLTETGVVNKYVVTLAEDRAGAIWAGSNTGGGLYRVANGNVQHFGRNEGLRSPDVFSVFVDGNDELWIGSTGGLSWFQDGHIHTVNSHHGLPGDQVFAILDDSYQRVWFLGYAGIAAIDKRRIFETVSGGRHKLNPILYRNAELQVTGTGTLFPNAARTPNGHLWFTISDGVLEVTPPDPGSHAPQFPVLVEDVTIDRVSHSEPGRIRIPPGARSLELRYTALTLCNSEAIRFRYRLEGFDKDWVDADTRRIAFYDNLKPRTYSFRVAASAGEEQWQESSALVLEQLPFFYQTSWFQALCAAGFLALLWAIYRYRVHQIGHEFNVRLEERVGERTRIARDLHDTLLQSFHGLMLRLQVVNKLLPEGKAKEQLEKTMERADQAIAEGRGAVYQLRSSATATNYLSEALSAVGRELSAENNAVDKPPTFDLVVEGQPRDLHPIIRDELYRISREALHNAFKHAHARHTEAEISYGDRVFRLRIRDDGQGIPAEILGRGRPGHYGLPGIRERARQIGAELNIWSRDGSGTEIELSLSGSIAYATSLRRSHLRLWGNSRKTGAGHI
jgi:signal transduction histidine kinase/ligand-binding sensor domain-containing protein